MLSDDFAGIVPIQEFLDSISERRLATLGIASSVTAAATSLEAARESLALVQAGKGRKENEMSKPLTDYLEELVSTFPEGNKPLIADTHNCLFAALDEGGHYTKPDITVSRPGIEAPDAWDWHHAGTVIELKYRTDIFNADGQIKATNESEEALIQLAKSARSLLMASRSCVVYVVAVFDIRRARLLRFDRSGFKASTDFDWTKEERIFPTFFWRLYNPTRLNSNPVRMSGEDDTLSIPTPAEKQRMHAVLCKNSFYSHYTLAHATEHSLWIQAVRFHVAGDKRVAKPVRCFTIGEPLSGRDSDGLFSRATMVYRVVLEEDADEDNPTVYALKDAWRQACRRPEVDFYDAIAHYCKTTPHRDTEMAECHGSIDLSIEPTLLHHNPTLHITCSTKGAVPRLERCHMRSLLTPVGTALNAFSSTKALARALETAVWHLEIAWNAGVLHRDVSEGNVLFKEVTEAGREVKGFLVDWDYAEFTPVGLEMFDHAFPGRTQANAHYQELNKSLKDMTGTPPFMAIKIMDNSAAHGPHHDLESVYWLLVWMVLRHTKHSHNDGSSACGNLFDSTRNALKVAWLQTLTPIADRKSSLYGLVDNLRVAVAGQNPGNMALVTPDDDDVPDENTGVKLTHPVVLKFFDQWLRSTRWAMDDAALPFVVPSLDSAKNERQTKRAQSLHQVAVRASHKRTREEANPVASASSEGTTAASGSRGSGSGSNKKTKTSPAGTPVDETPVASSLPLRRSARTKSAGSGSGSRKA
ncbi:hypothetical protein B0H17DRAFT_1329561 [Mycena rosella]|uniref:Fungal-type protein kinase domain-containing protein n=1 Tax=Mycena rosella TaxID=1033263 RepID=A0AAD7DR84_MYCRO|nr:hypothetical protein B0H17DRAFT_1329561 [Mycena rosella]